MFLAVLVPGSPSMFYLSTTSRSITWGRTLAIDQVTLPARTLAYCSSRRVLEVAPTSLLRVLASWRTLGRAEQAWGLLGFLVTLLPWGPTWGEAVAIDGC